MVTRNRRFATPHGYWRQDEKRRTERLVAEDSVRLVAEESIEEAEGNAPLAHDSASGSGEHLVLDLLPRVPLRPGIDLLAATRGAVPAGRAIPAGPDLLRLLGRRLRQSGRRLWTALAPVAGRVMRGTRRHGRRLLDWASWK
jgi:hypothetical protein